MEKRKHSKQSKTQNKRKRASEDVERTKLPTSVTLGPSIHSILTISDFPYSGKELPSCILIHIFGFMEAMELMRASCVCKMWKELIRDENNDMKIWKGACLKTWQVEEDEVVLACDSWKMACKTTPKGSMQEALKMSKQVFETCSTQLFLVHLKLTALPSKLFCLTQLERLSLFGNSLTRLPHEISKLIGLQNLWVYYNHLTSLPPHISSLHKLTSLGLSHNKLTSIPKELCNLTQLKRLELDYNHLESLPKELCLMHSLGTLYLSNNPVRESQLEVLRVNLNMVTDCDF